MATLAGSAESLGPLGGRKVGRPSWTLAALAVAAVLGIGEAQAQSPAPEPTVTVRPIYETSPGPATWTQPAVIGVRGDRVVLWTPAGSLAVDPDTGAADWVQTDFRVQPREAWMGGALLLRSDSLWLETPSDRAGAPAERRPLVKTTQWRLVDVATVGSQVWVLGWRPDLEHALLRLDGDTLVFERALGEGSVGIGSDGTALYHSTRFDDPAEASGIFRRVGLDEQRIDGAPDRPVLLRVDVVNGRTLLQLRQGVFRVDLDDGQPVLRRLSPEGELLDPWASFATETALWTTLLHEDVVLTDGTEDRSFLLRGERRYVQAAIGGPGGDFAAITDGEGVAIVDGRGEILHRVDDAISAVSLGEALLIVTARRTEDRSALASLRVDRFRPGVGLDRWGTLRVQPVPEPADLPWSWVALPAELGRGGGAVLLDQPARGAAELIRFDAAGAVQSRVTVRVGPMEARPTSTLLDAHFGGWPAQAFEPGFDGVQAHAVLSSDAVVLGDSARRLAFLIARGAPVEGASELLLERRGGDAISADGERVYWLDNPTDAGAGAQSLRSWSAADGIVDVGPVRWNARAQRGVGGRPFLWHENARIWLDPLLQVDESAELVEVFREARDDAAGFVVRDDGVWLLAESESTWSVSRWDFDRGAPELVASLPRDTETRRFGPYLWMLGSRPRPWITTSEVGPDGLRTRVVSTDGSGTRYVLRPGTHRGPGFVRVHGRTVGFEDGGQLLVAFDSAPDEPARLSLAPGLHGVTDAMTTERGLLVSAEDGAAGEHPWPPDASAGSPVARAGGPGPAFGVVPAHWAGREPWHVTDGGFGAPATVELVADLFPGPEGSNPAGFAKVPASSTAPEMIVFHAVTPTRGRELWAWPADGASAPRPVCELGAEAAAGVPEWARVQVGSAAVFVPAFVPGLGTEVVAIPFAAVRGEADCRWDTTAGSGGSGGSGQLRGAEEGCGCRSTRSTRDPEVGLWAITLSVLSAGAWRRRRSRCRRARSQPEVTQGGRNSNMKLMPPEKTTAASATDARSPLGS